MPQRNSAFANLRRFVKQKAPVEHCELCKTEITFEHQHLIEPANRKMVCTCDACAILFSNQGAGKYRRVPRRVVLLSDFQMTDSQWDSLMIPINMAFFFHSSPSGRVVALYPSPAGATESLLSLEAWEDIVEQNKSLKDMEPDVEGLLVNRVGYGRDHGSAEYYIAPIDSCYKLVGLIRARWHGLSGGSEVWSEIKQFFVELKERSIVR
jgi:hypothetical protein